MATVVAWRPRLSHRHPAAIDVGLALVLAALNVSYLWVVPAGHPALPGFQGPDVVGVLLALSTSLPLVARRRAPGAALAVVGLSAVAQAGLAVPSQGLGLVVALYSVAVYAPRRESLVALAVFAFFTAVSLVLADAVQYAAANALVFVTAWIVGDQRRAARTRVDALEARAARLERERDESARLAVLHEQGRIGTEIQDLVAHRLAAMLAQTRGADRLLDRDPQRAAHALAAVEESGRESLNELRRLLGLLRNHAPRGPARQPDVDEREPPAQLVGDAGDRTPSVGSHSRRDRAMNRLDAAFTRVRALPVVGQDALLAATVVAVDVSLLWLHDPVLLDIEGARGPSVLSVAILLLVTAPLAARRVAPHAVMVATTAGGLAAVLFDVPTQLFGPLVALYTIAVHRSRRAGQAWLAGLLALAAVMAPAVGQPGLLPGQVVIIVTAWLLGDRQRASRARDETLQARADELEQDRQRAEALAVSEERARIARELHDVLAHGISLMVVQAAGARRVLASDGERARGAVGQVVVAGEDSLGEIRRVVGLLDDAPAMREPQPGLGDVASIVDRFRDAGVGVRLEINGPVRALPQGIELSGCRIVQEALTNVLRHAGPSPRAAVTLDYGDRHLVVEVVNEGDGVMSPARDGHGLVGMRERTAMLGGRLETGPRPEGGFGVRAVLPLGEG